MSPELSLDAIRKGRLPGVGTDSQGKPTSLYTLEATGPEATTYLIGVLDDAIELLRLSRVTASTSVQDEIDSFLGRV
jgi:hypothetical protein